MAVDRVNAVFVGVVKDSLGFRCQLLEEPVTGAQMLAYEPEVWFERGNHLARLEAMGKRAPADGVRHAWPAQPPRKE